MNELNRVLTQHGYAIKKTSLTPRSTQALRKELTVSPQVNPKFSRMGPTQAFTVYTESPTRFYVPRWWGHEKYGEAEDQNLPEGEPLREDIQFIGKPYDYQKAIVDGFLEKGANGLICVPCGRGKTFMAIWTAIRLGKKFLIIVDKEFLMNQWKGELEALVPGIQVGIVQEDQCQIGNETIYGKPFGIVQLKRMCQQKGLRVGGNRDDLVKRIQAEDPSFQDRDVKHISYDCTIAMIQTLVAREFPKETFRSFGFSIFDECHHLGAAHFSRSLLKVQTKSMLGLSATPVREDGLTKVFEWFLGKPVYWEKVREPDPHVIVRCIQFESEDSRYTTIPTDYRGEMILGRLLTNVVECVGRNEKIAEILKSLCEDARRKVLVLSERISHLNEIENLLRDSGLTMSYYIGGMKEEEREKGARESRILLASYAMASEAMNIKTLNTVILASPRKKVEQSTGRILRVQKDQREVEPVIIDIVDSHGVYQGQWRQRAKYYKKCSYQIQYENQTESESLEGQEVKKEECLISDD